MKEITFHYKEKSFSCGACALRMVLETLLSTNIDESNIIDLLGSTKEKGTPLVAYQKNLEFLLAKVCIQLKISNNFEFIIKEKVITKNFSNYK
jgi:hypothetical protein